MQNPSLNKHPLVVVLVVVVVDVLVVGATVVLVDVVTVVVVEVEVVPGNVSGQSAQIPPTIKI